MLDGDLEIPETNREIAIHLQGINARLGSLERTIQGYSTIQSELTNLKDTVQQMSDRRFQLKDILLTSLILPVVGGTLVFLLTKGQAI